MGQFLGKRSGSNQKKLTSHDGADEIPSFSPDGSKIVFSSTRDGSSQIYIMDTDGSNQIRLTNSDSDDFCPAFSPDGNKIAFHSDRDGNRQIYIMDEDDSNQRNISRSDSDDGLPAFSPKLLLTSKAPSSSFIYAIGDIGPAGGYIFYINPDYDQDGWRYLEAAPGDFSGDNNDYRILWYNGNYVRAVKHYANA